MTLPTPARPSNPRSHGTGATVAELRSQSLADGAIGHALLHIERACLGEDRWAAAHEMIAAATRHPLAASADAGLYVGAPAVAFALRAAATGTTRYARALQVIDTHVTALTRRRLTLAHARIDRGERPRVGEYDLLYGLTGLGAHLLRRDPDDPTLKSVLCYLVRLTAPLPDDRDRLPGWWTSLDPSGANSPEFPGGHGNLGMAHGIAGPLALLALAKRHGVLVDGHTEAMQRICAWLDTWRQDSAGTGSWWPQWITMQEHHAGAVTAPGPHRPSWCYGTPGLARAQQLAAIALSEAIRRRMAEEALERSLTDPRQLAKITDPGLCHGAAGLLVTAHRMAQDSPNTRIAAHLPHLHSLLLSKEQQISEGLLEGATGPALADLHHQANGTPASGWDACLLIGS